MLHFASLGGVLHIIVQLAGGVLGNIAHTVHTMIDTPILTKL